MLHSRDKLSEGERDALTSNLAAKMTLYTVLVSDVSLLFCILTHILSNKEALIQCHKGIKRPIIFLNGAIYELPGYVLVIWHIHNN